MDTKRLAFDHHSRALPCKGAIDTFLAFAQEEREHHVSFSALADPFYELACLKNGEYAFAFSSSVACAVKNVILSVFLEARKKGKTHFLVSCIEDAPVMQALKLCEELGATVHIVPVTQEGTIDVKKCASYIIPETALLSITMAQGLTGVVQPLEEIASLLKEQDVLLHTDASYAIGQMPLSSAADYITFGSAFLHGSHSLGALFAKKNRFLSPYLVKEPFDKAACAAFSEAAKLSALARENRPLESAYLRDLFEQEILRVIPDARIFFDQTLRLPNTTVIQFPRAHAEALRYFLQRKKLYPNQSGQIAPHLHALLASSGYDGECVLSFSFSRMTTREDIFLGVAQIHSAVALLRSIAQKV